MSCTLELNAFISNMMIAFLLKGCQKTSPFRKITIYVVDSCRNGMFCEVFTDFMTYIP